MQGRKQKASRQALRGIGTATALSALSLFVVGCGTPSRSVSAVCHVWDTNGLQYHNQLAAMDAQMTNDPNWSSALTALLDIVAAPHNLSILYAQMANVAPEGNEPDFQAVSDFFEQAAKAESQEITDPLAAMGNGLLSSLEDAGSFTRTDDFLDQNCGIPGVSPPSGSTNPTTDSSGGTS